MCISPSNISVLWTLTHLGQWCWVGLVLTPGALNCFRFGVSAVRSWQGLSNELGVAVSLSGAAPSPFLAPALNMSSPPLVCFSIWETQMTLPAPLWGTRLWVSSYCWFLLLLNSVLWINKTQWLCFLHLCSQYFKWLNQRICWCWFVGAFQAVAENNFYRNEWEKRTELLVVLDEYWEWLVLNHWKKCFLQLVIRL